jgi:hypothetical protein
VLALADTAGAFTHLERGRTRGKIGITIDDVAR